MLKQIQRLIAIACFGILGLTIWFITPSALAAIQIPLTEITYETCSAELAEGAVTSDGSARRASCFIVTGTAENKTAKTLYDADIFGRIYDANGEPILQNRNRLGSIEEIPPGKSRFELRISVPANQPTPLQLKQFKASGFSNRVRF